MEQYSNVTIIRKANIYFNGQVTSRTVVFAGGEKKTLGIMLPGQYEFGTDHKEIMEILAGVLDVKLPGQQTWQTIHAGESFEVPAKSKFNLNVKEVTDYCCSYIAD